MTIGGPYLADGVRATGLQVEIDIVGLGERQQRGGVAFAERLQVADAERGALVAARAWSGSYGAPAARTSSGRRVGPGMTRSAELQALALCMLRR